jgi:hypothetical protein
MKAPHDILTMFIRESLLMVAMVLMGLTAAMTIARTADGLGPNVGDIFVFDPVVGLRHELPEPFTVVRVGHQVCVLDAATMHRDGGSLIVEQRQIRGSPIYQVHWAGARSSSGPDNCGSAAELVLSGLDLDRLVLTAEVWGVGQRSLVPDSRSTSSITRNAIQ